MSNDYRLNLLSEELDKYKAAVFKLTEENERLNSVCLQLQSSELKQHLEKVNCERENYKLRKALEEVRSYVNTQLDGFGNDVYGITKNQITTITNKINEVLG